MAVQDFANGMQNQCTFPNWNSADCSNECTIRHLVLASPGGVQIPGPCKEPEVWSLAAPH